MKAVCEILQWNDEISRLGPDEMEIGRSAGVLTCRGDARDKDVLT